MNIGNKGGIKICCKQCGRQLMCYTLQQDDNAIAVQNMEIKCTRCTRVMTLKKYTEGMISNRSKNGKFMV